MESRWQTRQARLSWPAHHPSAADKSSCWLDYQAGERILNQDTLTVACWAPLEPLGTVCEFVHVLIAAKWGIIWRGQRAKPGVLECWLTDSLTTWAFSADVPQQIQQAEPLKWNMLEDCHLAFNKGFWQQWYGALKCRVLQVSGPLPFLLHYILKGNVVFKHPHVMIPLKHDVTLRIVPFHNEAV